MSPLGYSGDGGHGKEGAPRPPLPRCRPRWSQSAGYGSAKERDLSIGGWFRTMYRLLLGQKQGPRLGTFVYMYGPKETADLIDERLEELSEG